jgi:hypothetical protein
VKAAEKRKRCAMSGSYFSGDPLHLVFITVFAVAGAWNLWTASQYGYVSGRFGKTTRANEPVIFWIFVSASAVVCVAGVYFLLCALLRVPPPWYP